MKQNFILFKGQLAKSGRQKTKEIVSLGRKIPPDGKWLSGKGVKETKLSLHIHPTRVLQNTGGALSYMAR